MLTWSLTPKNTIQEWKTKNPLWKIELTRRTAELEVYCIPAWIGHSYYIFDTDVEVYHLVPFNRIIRLLRDFHHWLRWGAAKRDLFGKRMEINRRSYEQGYAQAKKDLQEQYNLEQPKVERLLEQARKIGYVDGWNSAVKEMTERGWQNFKPI